MFHRNKKKSNLFFLLFFVLIVTIFFWTKCNNDRYLKRYYIENNAFSDLKKNSPRSKRSTEVLLNLKRAVVLFFAIVILILLICIFFIFKSNNGLLTNAYSYFMRDEEYYIYNELAKICEFDKFDFQTMKNFFENDNVGINEIGGGLAAVMKYLNLDYFAKQRGKDKKLYFFRYGNYNNDPDGEKYFYQSSVPARADENGEILQKFTEKGGDLEKLVDENRKDTDYHDFLGIKNKKIDEIEKFNFFNRIFTDICSYLRDYKDYELLIIAIKNLLFFNFFLDANNRTEEKSNDPNDPNMIPRHFETIHVKFNVDNPKEKLGEKYSEILLKINDDMNNLANKKEGPLLLNNSDKGYDINVRITENDNFYYIPDSIFIANLMDLYKKITSLNSETVVKKITERYGEGDKIENECILKAKYFLCSFTYTILQNYLFFLKKLMFIENFKKGYQKEIDKEAFLKFMEKKGNGEPKEEIKNILNDYLYPDQEGE